MNKQLHSGRHSLLTFLALVCLAAGAAAGTMSPLQGVGDLPFSADMPVFYDADGQARVHVAARVFERDLVRPKDGQPVFLSLRAKLARSGVVALDTTRTIQFALRDLDQNDQSSWTEPFRLVEFSAPIDSGTWAVTLEVSDGEQARSKATSVLNVVP